MMAMALHAASIPFWICAIWSLITAFVCAAKHIPNEPAWDQWAPVIFGLILSATLFAIAGAMWGA